MQFHGIGNEKHSAEVHHVTKCIYDHDHSKPGAGASAVKTQQAAQQSQQSQEPFSLFAWMDNYLSRGKSLLKGVWSGGDTAPGEIGKQSGQEQVLAQISESREAGDSGAVDRNPAVRAADMQQPDPSQAVHVSRAAQAASPAAAPREQEAAQTVDAAREDQERMWRRIRVRFKDIAGQLAGHLRGNTSRFQAKRSFQPKQTITRGEPEKNVKSKRDAVEIDKYHVEESYLLDSYDRKGGYSKLSTKK